MPNGERYPKEAAVVGIKGPRSSRRRGRMGRAGMTRWAWRRTQRRLSTSLSQSSSCRISYLRGRIDRKLGSARKLQCRCKAGSTPGHGVVLFAINLSAGSDHCRDESDHH
uniref:Uncharacterized protein n=1 Tax=Zea mays TaxID=4577 RepID=C0PMC2_MAIZE|nr:unknown [Zea mays]